MTKLLGISIDDQLKFNIQSAFVVKKLNSCIFFLHKFRKLLPLHVLKIIFNCIGFSYLTYCLHTYYDFLCVADVKLLERKYIRCGRTILNDNESSNDDILKMLGWLPLSDIVLKTKKNMLISVLNGSCAPTLASYLSRPPHNHHTRFNSNSYNVPNSNKNIGKYCFQYWAPRVINDIMKQK